MPRPKKVIDEDACPICGQFMSVICSGFKKTPFINGRKYDAICFTCLNVPKTWEVTMGKAEDGSEDVWKGPYWDWKHIKTAEEMVEEGVCTDLKVAKKSVNAIKSLIRKMTDNQKQKMLEISQEK